MCWIVNGCKSASRCACVRSSRVLSWLCETVKKHKAASLLDVRHVDAKIYSTVSTFLSSCAVSENDRARLPTNKDEPQIRITSVPIQMVEATPTKTNNTSTAARGESTLPFPRRASFFKEFKETLYLERLISLICCVFPTSCDGIPKTNEKVTVGIHVRSIIGERFFKK